VGSATAAFTAVALLSCYVLFAPSPVSGGGVPGADKLVHLALFALLAATARWRFGSSPAVLAAVAAYAVGSEVAQALVLSERSGDVYDVGADLLGAAVGWLLAGRRLRPAVRPVTQRGR
jgi:hypothetical protein